MNKDVEFQDVYYTVKEKKNLFSFEETKLRDILKGVSGNFKNGQLSGIMGPSGAGKSSLLNALSGLITRGVEGVIKNNRKTSCYITQEDIHRKHLSVRELMDLACRLKLKNEIHYNTHEQLITEILSSLNLNHRQNVTAVQLSGGEKKRLSIALELVANPTIFFLDEPTSGLDDVTAVQCIRLLKELARQGRTVVCTIHQPSAKTFSLFDQIFVLAAGQCVYQGTPKSLVPLLSNLDMTCPSHYNPADYIIELCDSDDRVIPMLSDTFQNGKLQCIHLENSISGIVSYQIKSPLTSMIMERTKPPGGTLLQKMKAFSKLMHRDYAMSSFNQFIILFKMMMVVICRNRTIFYIQLFHHILCGGGMGLIFYNAADEGERMFDHLKYCMGIVFFLVYTQVMVPILSYPLEVKIVKRECFNRWYSLLPYYAAMTLSRVPVQVMLNLLFLMLTYFLCGLPSELWRFGLFTLIAMITSLVAEGMGLWIGATFSITNGCAIGPMFIAPFLGLAIYGFDFAEQISTFMNFIMKFSFIRGSVISLVFTVFGFNRRRLNCNAHFCPFDDPKVLLKYLDIENISLVREMFILLSIMTFFRLLCYLSLRKRFNS